jgi:hypothetical protein
VHSVPGRVYRWDLIGDKLHQEQNGGGRDDPPFAEDTKFNGEACETEALEKA